MNPVEKLKAIEYFVHDIYMVEHNKRLAIFLTAYGEQVRKSTILSIQLGIPIMYPPLIFDLRIPTEQLVKNLAAFDILYRDHNEYFFKIKSPRP